MKKLLKISLILFLTAVIVLGFVLPVNMVGNWYQQFLPNLNGRQITDIYFTDSLKGYAITNKLGDTSLILKTTNGGNNWVINRADSGHIFTRTQFIDQSTGFVGGLINAGSLNYILKTTNAGNNWTYINTPMFTYQADMSVLNEDTIWFVMDETSTGGIFRTTNGGVNWTVNNTYKPYKIYMYNRDTGFASRNNTFLYKTTDSGLNWIQITGENGFRDIYFINSQTGWKANGPIKKTTNGGLNWIAQVLPSGGMFSFTGALKMSVLNKDTIWAVGGSVQYPNLQSRGVVYRTTNGGDNWLFQVPDTAIPSNTYYSYIQFINARVGWAHTQLIGVHTTNGGDTTWLVGVKQISSEIPQDYKLFQNYPNPFNPVTNIKYTVKRQTSNVKLIVYDVQGRFVRELVNQKQNAGTFEVNWDSSNFPSGVYFYKIETEEFIETKKMVLIK